MIETVTRKRIEILTDVALVRRVTDAIDRADARLKIACTRAVGTWLSSERLSD